MKMIRISLAVPSFELLKPSVINCRQAGRFLRFVSKQHAFTYIEGNVSVLLHYDVRLLSLERIAIGNAFGFQTKG